MNIVIVRRGKQQVGYRPQEFWSLARSGQFKPSDLIFNPASGQFLPAHQFADLKPYIPAKGLGGLIEDLVSVALGAGTAFVAGAGVVLLIESIFGGASPVKIPERGAPNYEPLESWKKEFVRQRDDETCIYCHGHAPRGHVDHKTSRVNGGSNLLRNLAWACAHCNCSKGRMNAPQFKRLMWA